MEEDIARAVSRGKDDIARVLIRRVHPRRQAAAALEARLKRVRDGIAACEANYARQAEVYAEICQRAAVVSDRPEGRADVSSWRQGAGAPSIDPDEAEIEMELLQYKEAFEAGRAS